MCLHTHIVNSLNFQSQEINSIKKLSKQHEQNHELFMKYSQFCPLSHIM